MANYKANPKIIDKLSDADRAALLSIYTHRCLTEPLLFNYFYLPDSVSIEEAGTHIRQMIQNNLLFPTDYSNDFPALFLTTLGVETVKYLYGDRLTALYKPGKNKTKLPLSYDLKMSPININHQMHLNCFGLEFESYTRGIIDYSYYDEKFMPPASNFMMPDGMIELPNEFLFLEMDMGTEDVNRLAQKWNSYRTFLTARSGIYAEKPISMLFLVDGVKNINIRRRNIIRTIIGHIGDQIGNNFDAYVDTPCACHEYVKTNCLHLNTEMKGIQNCVMNAIAKHDFKASRPAFLSEMGLPYAYYIRQLSPNRKVRVTDGRVQEYILDLWIDGRVSVLKNMLYYPQTQVQLMAAAGREIPYVLVVPSVSWILPILNIAGNRQPESVYFTTPARLASLSWPHALFQIDQLWNLNHFSDMSLGAAVHEKRLARNH